MLVLGLNTAFTAMEAAIVRDGDILADARETMARGQDKALPEFIDRLLTKAGIGLADLDRVAVVTGPGSFTGIRIGVAYARGLALATDVPCVGVTSVEASIPAGMAGPVLGCIPAQKRPPDQTWWVQGVDGNAGIADTVEVGLDDLKPMLTGFTAPIFMQAADALGPLAETLDIRPLVPSAVTAALKGAEFDPSRHTPAPVYARDPDAKLPGAPQ